MSTVARLIRAVVLLAAFLPASFCQQSPALHDWEAFRNAFPYHTQVVAAGNPYPDGGRTLIVSEPPPQVTLAQIQNVDPELLAHSVLPRVRVGFDGWLRDAVFELPPVDDARFQELIAKL